MSNEITFSNDEFYISYRAERSEFAKFCDDLCHAAGRPVPKDLPETALCIREAGRRYPRFLILYGDHREAYTARVPDLAKCLAYFNENIEQIAHSSDTPKETRQ